jgi:hypothetical protein
MQLEPTDAQRRRVFAGYGEGSFGAAADPDAQLPTCGGPAPAGVATGITLERWEPVHRHG